VVVGVLGSAWNQVFALRLRIANNTRKRKVGEREYMVGVGFEERERGKYLHQPMLVKLPAAHHYSHAL